MADHDEQADRLEKQADKMQEESERVSSRIGESRDDWEQKQADQTIPGAQEDLDKILDPEPDEEEEEE
jgi:phage shock protein A